MKWVFVIVLITTITTTNLQVIIFLEEQSLKQFERYCCDQRYLYLSYSFHFFKKINLDAWEVIQTATFIWNQMASRFTMKVWLYNFKLKVFALKKMANMILIPCKRPKTYRISGSQYHDQSKRYQKTETSPKAINFILG